MIEQKLSFRNHDIDNKHEFGKPKHHCDLFNYEWGLIKARENIFSEHLQKI